MLFNSLDFLLFLPLVFLLYWFLSKKYPGIQNPLLLVASYFFYACWDVRFLFLLVFSTILDYGSGLKITQTKTQKNRKIWLWISITINLGLLGLFKYYDFFVDSFAGALSLAGLQCHPKTLQLILPVGISFYTFHGLSYVIDCYHHRIKAEKNPIDYALFVSFFPLLVAGPIERAAHLLPQLKTTRPFIPQKMTDGLRQILWGLFKKVVIADNCASLVNPIFEDTTLYGSSLVLGAVLFSIQIYGDFSGYSDIALGVARLFGIELLKNFSYPYFSRNIAEFWRRWHISLSSWFRDYLYIPLGGSQVGILKKIRNTFIIFIVSGFWHGANWTFIFWGFLNALYFLPLLLSKRNRLYSDIIAKDHPWPNLKELLSVLFTFSLSTFAWIFFRSESLAGAFSYVTRIFSPTLFSLPSGVYLNTVTLKPAMLLILMLFFILTEWKGRASGYAIESIGLSWPRPLRLAFYYSIILAVIIFSGKEQAFIYFQF